MSSIAQSSTNLTEETTRRDYALLIARERALAAYPHQRTRIEHACAIVRHDQIAHVGAQWQVESQSHAGHTYLATTGRCTCINRAWRPDDPFCRHMMAVALWKETNRLLDEQWYATLTDSTWGVATATSRPEWFVFQTETAPAPVAVSAHEVVLGWKCQPLTD